MKLIKRSHFTLKKELELFCLILLKKKSKKFGVDCLLKVIKEKPLFGGV